MAPNQKSSRAMLGPNIMAPFIPFGLTSPGKAVHKPPDERPRAP